MLLGPLDFKPFIVFIVFRNIRIFHQRYPLSFFGWYDGGGNWFRNF